MNDIKMKCPHCNQSLEVPAEMLGKIADCPSCGGQMQIPSQQAVLNADAMRESTEKVKHKVGKRIWVASSVMACVLGLYHLGQPTTDENFEEQDKRNTDSYAAAGNGLGEEVGKFALESMKADRLVKLEEGMVEIWNFHYRDRYAPSKKLLEDMEGHLAGSPFREEWEKSSDYETKLIPLREEAKSAWERLSTGPITCKCKIHRDSHDGDLISDRGGYKEFEGNTSDIKWDFFLYNADKETLRFADLIDSRYEKKGPNFQGYQLDTVKWVKLWLSNSPEIACPPSKAKQIFDTARWIGLRFRCLSISEVSVGIIVGHSDVELTGYVEELVFLDTKGGAIFYWGAGKSTLR